MKDWTSVLMVVILCASALVGYRVNGIDGVLVAIKFTLATGFFLGIGFLILIFRNYGRGGN